MNSSNLPSTVDLFANARRHPALSLFTDLLAAPSVSGNEAAIAAVICEKLTAMGYPYERGPDGNILVRLTGRDPDGPLVCLASHMDELGMVVTAIGKDGSLRVNRSGGLYPWKLGEGPVEIVGDHATITGVLSLGSTHTAGAADQTMTWERVRVLTGLTPAQLAAAGVRPGSLAAPARAVRGPVLLGDPADPLVGAWTFDDRMGCVALLRLLQWLKDDDVRPAVPTLIAFTVSEEIGGLGAKSLALREQPEVFIAVDGSPTPAEAPLAIDGRPAMWSKDRLAVYDQALLREFLERGAGLGIDIQTAAYTGAASDASLVRAAGLAPRIVCFGHVRENSHGYEVARLSVFDNMLTVLSAFVRDWGG
jgi:putative aminopeptidase FrvX